MLKIKHLNKSFHGKKILNDVTLTVKKGEIALFLGSSGVGKSTLLRILNNLETINSGTIELDDTLINVNSINTTHTVGMVFQHFNLFEHLTVEQNITLPLERVLKKNPTEAQAIAHQLLQRYGLLEQKNKYALQPSGGQKQRLAIARALVMHPKIICLDEPTSALDPVLTAYVAHNIQQLANDGYIVLVATHDTDLLKKLNCTIYLMSEGSIIETAQSQELNAHSDTFPRIKKFIAGHE
ncbi:MAG TPA: ATP-binding cassette domain-containing protein [Candidatus Babeliales bacterium]|nr:ATP-binding cassette domain-containing protein [Candidatus Babeliales bacterium]